MMTNETKKHTHTMDRETYEYTIEFEAIEFTNINEAIAHAETADLEAIHLNGKYFVLDPLEADRLDEAGATFAFVYDLDGKIVTIPVN
jgi:hypothetical protein